MEPAGVGLIAASLLNGLRHGFDVDHVAAIGDLASAQTDRRRAFYLTLVYAAGHAAIVLALGAGAILLGARIPASVDQMMSKVVGATLVVLGVYALYSAIRYRGRARLVGRWRLIQGLVASVRQRRMVPIVIEHEHEHSHDDLHAHSHDASLPPSQPGTVLAAVKTHVHVHTHVAAMPTDPLPAYGGPATFGVGILHGVGAETPTQVLLFVTAAGVGTALLGFGVLIAFVAGLLASNVLVASLFVVGMRAGKRVPHVYAICAVATGLFSLAVGVSYLTS